MEAVTILVGSDVSRRRQQTKYRQNGTDLSSFVRDGHSRGDNRLSAIDSYQNMHCMYAGYAIVNANNNKLCDVAEPGT